MDSTSGNDVIRVGQIEITFERRADHGRDATARPASGDIATRKAGKRLRRAFLISKRRASTACRRKARRRVAREARHALAARLAANHGSSSSAGDMVASCAYGELRELDPV